LVKLSRSAIGAVLFVENGLFRVWSGSWGCSDGGKLLHRRCKLGYRLRVGMAKMEISV
jgi:hypothetical protein